MAVYGLLHPGSGLGNQLHRYVATRCLALDKGYEFSMIGRETFKGKSFMNLDFGKENDLPFEIEYPAGKIIPKVPMVKVFGTYLPRTWDEKINYYNPEFNFIADNTIIDGEFQDERYFDKHLDKILSWFNLKPELLSGFYDDICVINFRGGEYKLYPELYLTQDYWDTAIQMIKDIKSDVVFKVVTDDVEEAKKFFPDFQVSNEIGDDWTSILHAQFLILANSSFAIFPALLNQNAHTIIAPRYWARRNTKEWSMPQNYYKKFTYI